MDFKQAKGLLHHHINTWKGKFPSPHFEACEVAIEAIEKQIPKRPKADNNGNYAEYFEEWLECPECGEAIPEYTSDNETECYCVGCGQKLSWD